MIPGYFTRCKSLFSNNFISLSFSIPSTSFNDFYKTLLLTVKDCFKFLVSGDSDLLFFKRSLTRDIDLVFLNEVLLDLTPLKLVWIILLRVLQLTPVWATFLDDKNTWVELFMALSGLVWERFFKGVWLSPQDGMIECSVFVVLLWVHSQINFITRIINFMRFLQIFLTINLMCYFIYLSYKINYFIIHTKQVQLNLYFKLKHSFSSNEQETRNIKIFFTFRVRYSTIKIKATLHLCISWHW